jgi:peptidyl-prolyl cis-trans isomerase SurA
MLRALILSAGRSGGALGLICTLLLGQSSQAQEAQRIVAVVNDEVISNSDLANRVRLTLLGSNLQDTPQNRQRVAGQILRQLIEDRLKIQEAARLSINVNDNEIDERMAALENSIKMPRGGLMQLLRSNGIPRSAMEGQMRADISWQKIVFRRLRATIDIGDDEVEEVLNRFRSSEGVTENWLYEIFLAVDSPEQDEEVKTAALGLMEQIKRGTPFPAVAQQFSQSASAAAGGDIGWVQQRDEQDDINRAIAQLQPGQMVGEPVRSVAGYYIYTLRDRRRLSAPSPDEAVVSLSQLVIPLRPQATPAEVASQTDLANTVRDVVSGCADLRRVADELGAPAPTQLERLRIADLSPTLRPIVTKLKVGEASEPTRLNPGILLIMLCSKQETGSNLPSREDITENLLRERLELAARRYMRDLRRVAVVDIRG